MNKEIHKYCEDLSNQDDQILNDLKEYAYKNEKMYQMICGPIVGNFLSLMIKILQPKNVLEIGCSSGSGQRLANSFIEMKSMTSSRTERLTSSIWLGLEKDQRRSTYSI